MKQVLSLFFCLALILGVAYMPEAHAARAVMLYKVDREGNIVDAQVGGEWVNVTSQKGNLRTPAPADTQLIEADVNYFGTAHSNFTTPFAPQIDRSPAMTLGGAVYEDILMIYEAEGLGDGGNTAGDLHYGYYSGDFTFWDAQSLISGQDPMPTGIRRKSMMFDDNGVAHIVYGYTTVPGGSDRASLSLMYVTFDVAFGLITYEGNINPANERGLSYPIVRVNSAGDVVVANMDYDVDGDYYFSYKPAGSTDWVWEGLAVSDPNGTFGWGVVNTAVDPVTNDVYMLWPSDINGDLCADIAIKKWDYAAEEWDPAALDEGYTLALGNSGVMIADQEGGGEYIANYDFLCFPDAIVDESGIIHCIVQGNPHDWGPNDDQPATLTAWGMMGTSGALYYTHTVNPRDPSEWTEPIRLLDPENTGPDGFWEKNIAAMGGLAMDETGTMYAVIAQPDSMHHTEPNSAQFTYPMHIKMLHKYVGTDWDVVNVDTLFSTNIEEEPRGIYFPVTGPEVIGESHTSDPESWGWDIAFALGQDANGTAPSDIYYLRGPYRPSLIGTFMGTVTDGNGNPLNGAMIRFSGEQGTFSASSASDGSYSVSVPEGEYSIVASLFGYESDSAVQTIEAEETITLDFTLAELSRGTLSGRVFDAYLESTPGIENAMVEILNTPIDEVMTDAMGDFSISGIPYGTYTVQITSMEDYATLSQEVTINSSEVMEYFGLIAAYSFEAGDLGWTAVRSGGGRITWEHGEPTYELGPSAYHGINCWGTEIDTYYRNNRRVYLISEEYTLAENNAPYQLEMMVWVNTVHQEDGCNVQISTDGGDNWTIIEPSYTPIQPEGGYDETVIAALPNQPGWTGTYGDWFPAYFDLSAYEGMNVTFRVAFGSTSQNEDADNRYAGVYVDNVIVRGQETYDIVSVEMVDTQVASPSYYAISQNYPNPFNPKTAINYQLPVASEVSLKIYDMSGRLVKNLVSETQEAGHYRVFWDGTDDNGNELGSGVYLYRIDANDFQRTKRMVLLR